MYSPALDPAAAHVAEALGRQFRSLQTRSQQSTHDFISEKLHAAVGLMDDKEFARAQQFVGITRDRMASSLARPPALRITCVSPSARPAYLAGSSRTSMQVRIAKRRAGGKASLLLSPKFEA